MSRDGGSDSPEVCQPLGPRTTLTILITSCIVEDIHIVWVAQTCLIWWPRRTIVSSLITCSAMLGCDARRMMRDARMRCAMPGCDARMRCNIAHLWWPRRLTLAFLIISNAMDDEAMRWTMRRCDGRWGDAMDDEAMLWGDAMDDEAMRWTMRRCDGRWGDAMDDGNIAPSHRLIASPHRPSHRLIVHRIASSHRLIVHRIAS